jgi:hypothetical protein
MRDKDQILLENVYSKVIQENLKYTPQSTSANKQTFDEIQIGNDLYSADYDMDIHRSVERHGTFYSDPKIDILAVRKYNPQTDEEVEIPLNQINPELLSQIRTSIADHVNDMIDGGWYDNEFYDDEPDHPDI